MEEMAGGASTKDRPKLINILYRDLDRLNSFYAQAFHGDLLKVTSEESIRHMYMGFNITRGVKHSRVFARKVKSPASLGRQGDT